MAARQISWTINRITFSSQSVEAMASCPANNIDPNQPLILPEDRFCGAAGGLKGHGDTYMLVNNIQIQYIYDYIYICPYVFSVFLNLICFFYHNIKIIGIFLTYFVHCV